MYKTDIFIPWCPSTSFVGSDAELRYCLRSVSTYWPINKVYIVSEYAKPEWLCNVEWLHIDIVQPYQKEAQIKMAIEKAIGSGISDPFLYINDDQYMIDNQCVAWLQHYVSNQCSPDLAIRPTSAWAKMTIDTLKKLRDEGHPYHNWCTHMPWLVKHASYWKAKQFFNHYIWQLESGVLNLQTNCRPLFLTELHKLRIQFTEHVQEEYLSPYTCFLNHNDNGIKRSWYLIQKLFPEKSRYEA